MCIDRMQAGAIAALVHRESHPILSVAYGIYSFLSLESWGSGRIFMAMTGGYSTNPKKSGVHVVRFRLSSASNLIISLSLRHCLFPFHHDRHFIVFRHMAMSYRRRGRASERWRREEPGYR